MTGGADDQRFFVGSAQLRDFGRRFVETEINDHIRALYDCPQVVALVNLADYFEVGEVFHATKQGLAHATFCSGDDDTRHDFRYRSFF